MYSAIFKDEGFRTAMDVQGVIVGLNTVCFIVHTIVRFAKRGS